MSFGTIALFFVALSAITVLLDQPWKNKSFVATRLCLDLRGLVALLPAELQRDDFLCFREHYVDDKVYVGLVLPPPRDSSPIPCGNPRNVGLEFDKVTAKLIAVHPDGLPLGIK